MKCQSYVSHFLNFLISFGESCLVLWLFATVLFHARVLKLYFSTRAGGTHCKSLFMWPGILLNNACMKFEICNTNIIITITSYEYLLCLLNKVKVIFNIPHQSSIHWDFFIKLLGNVIFFLNRSIFWWEIKI